MDARDASRRALLGYGSAAAAALALLRSPALALAFPVRPGEEVLPWLDSRPPTRSRTSSGSPSTGRPSTRT